MSDCMVHYLCDYIVVLHILIYTPMIVPPCKGSPDFRFVEHMIGWLVAEISEFQKSLIKMSG